MGVSIIKFRKGISKNNTEYIEVFFKDNDNEKTTSLHIFEQGSNAGWLYDVLTKSIHNEKFTKELTKILSQSYVTTYEEIDIIVFSGETEIESFEWQKYKKKNKEL